MQKRFTDIKEIPLNLLVIGLQQVRVTDVGKDIDELAESIRKVGLLEPIVVAPVDDGKFEIITGQRRFLAHQRLGAESILAAILDERVSEIDAKIISLTENMMRRDLSSRDLVDVCTALYRKYGTVAMVSEVSGLPANQVSQYIKFDRLVPELKDLVKSGRLKLKDALRAQDAASVTGTTDPATAVMLAEEMSVMSGAQQDRLVQDRRDSPNRPISEVIEDQKTQKRITQITVTLSGAAHQNLQSFARDEGTTQDDAARILIEGALLDKGFGG